VLVDVATVGLPANLFENESYDDVVNIVVVSFSSGWINERKSLGSQARQKISIRENPIREFLLE